MNRPTKLLLEQELYDYQANLKYLDDLKEEIITSSGYGEPDMPRGTETSDTTADKAIKIMTTKAIMECSRRIEGVKRVLDLYSTDEEMKKLINLYYLKRTHTPQGVAQELHIDLSTFYRRKNELLKRLGFEFGWIK